MKISINWLKELINFDLPEVMQLADKVGAQLGAVEEVIDLGEKYRGLVIVRVVKCTKIPDSDHLNHCYIDDGGITPDVKRNSDNFIEVVCGAPNVTEGAYVVWLPQGSTVPSSYGTSDPFVLSTRTLRGVESSGMLASPKELAFGDNHDGLLLLDQPAEVGADFAATYGLNDYLIDIENKMFTHRPDCFGQLGLAREVAGITGHQFVSPDWYRYQHPRDIEADSETTTNDDETVEMKLEVKNELPLQVSRFIAVTLSGVSVRPSPIWLQSILVRQGMRPLNNIVDITNYLMLLTGQPLHAYDYDKLKALDGKDVATLVIRNPKPNEKLQLLNGKSLEPRHEAIMIASDSQLIGIGGVMGGQSTEVDNSTKNIILEVANFDMFSIRKTAMTHGLFTDAVTRNNKGQSPLQNLAVARRAVTMLDQLASAKQMGPVIDINNVPDQSVKRGSANPAISIEVDFVNLLLGLTLTAERIQTILKNVEFEVEIEANALMVTAPFWRTDIQLREDVVEEIGRLHGYDKLPRALPPRDLSPAVKDERLELKSKLRNILSRAGANEVLTYSFVHEQLLNKVRQDPSEAFSLSNALSPELQYYRLSLSPSLLEKVHPNIKAGYNEFALFELGKVHAVNAKRDVDLPIEIDRLALVLAVDSKTTQKNYYGAAYYQAKTYLDFVVDELGVIGEVRCLPLDETKVTDDVLMQQLCRMYEANRSALIYIGQKLAGVIGEYRSDTRSLLKLPEYCAGFELDLAYLDARVLKPYSSLSRFPKVSQDLTLKVPASLLYDELYDFVSSSVAKFQPDDCKSTLIPLALFQREDDTSNRQITFRITTSSSTRTLSDKQLSEVITAVSEAAGTKYGAVQI